MIFVIFLNVPYNNSYKKETEGMLKTSNNFEPPYIKWRTP